MLTKETYFPARMNLLRDEISVQELDDLLKDSSNEPLLPPLGSECWNQAALRKWLDPLVRKACIECMEPLPVLTAEMYAEFHLTGKRLSFERVYFERRRKLARAAMALLLCGGEDSMLQASLKNKIEDIAHEVSWALPASIGWHPSGIAPQEIDLFCAETANLMAEMMDVFGSVLSESLKTFIRGRLKNDVFENYVKRHEEFWWTRTTNNWNAVCHQGILGAALSQARDSRLLAEMLGIAKTILPRFLTGFTTDGGSTEGPIYWWYGFGWLSMLNEQLELRTAGRLSLFEKDSHVGKIARFGPSMVLPGDRLVNFSDCPESAVLRPALLCYLGKRLDEPLCLRMGLRNYKTLLSNPPLIEEQRMDFMQLSRIFLHFPDQMVDSAQTEEELQDIFFEHLGVVVAHGRDAAGRQWHFAAKAGHNAEHHNHNDCGSYLLNINETGMIIELGAPEYVKDFFKPEHRYEFLAARTLGHSLPVINGSEQAEGEKYRAEILQCDMGQEQVTMRIDATRCYAEGALCKKFIRTFAFDKAGGGLTVTDEFELEAVVSLQTVVITNHPVAIKGDVAIIEASECRLQLHPLEDTTIQSAQQLAYHNHVGEILTIRRIIFEPRGLSNTARIRYRVTCS